MANAKKSTELKKVYVYEMEGKELVEYGDEWKHVVRGWSCVLSKKQGF